MDIILSIQVSPNGSRIVTHLQGIYNLQSTSTSMRPRHMRLVLNSFCSHPIPTAGHTYLATYMLQWKHISRKSGLPSSRSVLLKPSAPETIKYQKFINKIFIQDIFVPNWLYENTFFTKINQIVIYCESFCVAVCCC